MRPPLFIVLEGVDGAGTTTHTRELGKRLKQRGVPVHPTAEPSQGPVGSLLRQMLSGRVIAGGRAAEGGHAQPPGWRTMALLFAADRVDHVEAEILPSLARGFSVVCDRYDHSSVAYQSATGGGRDAITWIRECNRHARRPDLTLVLDVPPEVAAERRDKRPGAGEIYDSPELQAQLCAFYAELETHFPDERVVHVDAVGSVEEVASRILAQVERL